MTSDAITRGGVIAAGEGSRLGGDGCKPMVEVRGTPLLAHTLSRYAGAGLEKVVVIVREQDAHLASWVETHYAHLDPRVIVKTTPASSVSFVEVVTALGPGRSILSTVDAVCTPEAFGSFLEAAAFEPPEALVLAVTEFVDDEKPLWVHRDAATGDVRALGGERGDAAEATAGIYVVPHAILEIAEETMREAGGAPPLRRLLAAWVDAGGPTRAIRMPKVVDVDRPDDVREAESFLRAAEEGTT